MSNVLVEKQKIDILANAISNKSGEPVTMTLEEMVEAVDGIETGSSAPTLQTKTATYTPTETQQTATITADSGYDGLDEVDITVNAISSTYVGSGITRLTNSNFSLTDGDMITIDEGYASDSLSTWIGNVVPGLHVTNNVLVDENTGLVEAYAHTTADNDGLVGWAYADNNYIGTLQLDTQAATTITPSTTSQIAVAAGKYTTGAVTVAAMPSGTEGTPTATKGTVSNHSVSVIPSVTNTTGYITGETHTGTAVTVSASELVSGSETKTANGTYDVTNLASVTVNIPFVTYYTGTTDPPASLGNDGDIYLKTTGGVQTWEVVFPETSLTGFQYGDAIMYGGAQSITGISVFDIVEGDTYRVTIDGTIYSPIAAILDDADDPVIGAAWYGGGDFTNAPYEIVSYNTDNVVGTWIYLDEATATTHTFKVEHLVE